MQHLEHQEQEPIFSQEHKQQQKVKQFKKYLVSSGCATHLLKFLLGIRNKQEADDSLPTGDVLTMFYEYIGAQPVDTSEHDALLGLIQEQKRKGEAIKQQIQGIKAEIQSRKSAKLKAEEQKRLKEQEQALKNAKKGGKK